MSCLRTLAILAAVAALVVPACKSSSVAATLPADDMKPTGKFDRNNLIDLATMTDVESLTSVAVQNFFAHNPYNASSFLETYQSNGVRAVDAIIAAARTYRINPLVFLVYAEMTQGLMAERTYPFPPERVEYVFGCGCIAQNDCLPALAGFDRQVDCLGQQLRQSLEAIANGGSQRTNAGWGPNITSTTLDGLKVTPEDAATAAFYDRTPRVNPSARDGTWLLWSILQLYENKLQYSGPVGAVDGRWIGDPCAFDTACALDGAICATNYPDGLCTVKCTGPCPSDTTKAPAYCTSFRDGGFCFQICNGSATDVKGNCRDGYECLHLVGVGESKDAEYVCTPKNAN